MERGIYHLIFLGILMVLILIIIFSFLVYYIVRFASRKIHKELITLKSEQAKLRDSIERMNRISQNQKE
ncbi:hypothetical protein [Paenibacillus sp. FSL R7-0128]|uniref:hypothetical protein n=1 Tax=Paenibacillus sp. FSL R7-0128 TaxID=2954529 RepID=UPI0030F5AB2E